MDSKKCRLIAYYLPQYHPIPENDQWWGKGFTEWRNVASAKPLFKGHQQPKIPADLGFYDLRIAEIQEEQARLAKEAGIEGFIYWHYWFGKGKRLLEMPFNNMLKNKNVDFPFCLGWANHSWSNKTWEKKGSFSKSTILIEQTYLEEDFESHFYDVLPAFKDVRYIRVDDKPLFLIYDPYSFKNVDVFIKKWNDLAKENNLKGIHFVAHTTNLLFKKQGDLHNDCKSVPITDASYIYDKLRGLGFDAINSIGMSRAEYSANGKLQYLLRLILSKVFNVNMLTKINQRTINKMLFVAEDKQNDVYPTLIPNWDRSPRAGKKAVIYTNSTPEVFEDSIKDCLELIKNKNDENKIVFIKSWNEWGEGNYLEPDLHYGSSYLDVLSKTIKNSNKV